MDCLPTLDEKWPHEQAEMARENFPMCQSLKALQKKMPESATGVPKAFVQSYRPKEMILSTI